MNTKSLRGVKLDDTDKGEVTAVFATFNVVDKDGDVTLPGAFTEGAEVLISAYGHKTWEGALPVGKGTIQTTKTEALLKGQFFMDTQHGRDTFYTVKELQGKQEWSYGYDTVDSEPGEKDGQRVRFLKRQEVHEVSPVLLGAGIGTRTLSTKARKDSGAEYKAIRGHKAAVTNRAWDEASVVEGLPANASVSDLRSVYAWVDGDPEAKASYKFPHHHGVGGPANLRALLGGIAVLNGACGGVDLPEDERKAVYDHLAGHLRDADREPPELRSLAGGLKLSLNEEAFDVLGRIGAYLDSAKRVDALRAQKGKHLSQVNLEALDWVGEELDRLVSEHKAMTRRFQDTPREAVAEEFVRFLKTIRRAS
jgi:hypothetical protein